MRKTMRWLTAAAAALAFSLIGGCDGNEDLEGTILGVPVDGVGENAGSSGLGASYQCTLPCLTSEPTISVTTVSSATGGSVDVSFSLSDVENISSVVVYLYRFSATTATFSEVDRVTLPSPVLANETVTLIAPPGMEAGSDELFPEFRITALSPGTPGAADQSDTYYYLDPDFSTTDYTWWEVTEGSQTGLAKSPYVIPKLTITN